MTGRAFNPARGENGGGAAGAPSAGGPVRPKSFAAPELAAPRRYAPAASSGSRPAWAAIARRWAATEGVSTQPGQTQFTTMPSGARLRARFLLTLTSAALAAV